MTMRTLILSIFAAVIMCTAFAVSADAATLRLDPPSLSVDVSQHFTSRVLLDTDPGEQVCSALARIQYDAARLEVVGVDVSDSLFPGAGPSDRTVESGVITFNRNDSADGFTMQCTTTSTAGLVGTIHFRARTLGSAQVSFLTGGSTPSGVFVREGTDFANVLRTTFGASYSVVDFSPPVVEFLAPFEGATISGVYDVTVRATDNLGISRVELYINGALHDTRTTAPYSFPLDTNYLANGKHILKAVAYDVSGQSAFREITITTSNVDTIRPEVSITHPQNEQVVSGIISIAASASDNQAVHRVEFSFNGVFIGSDITAPYSVAYDTRKVPDGTYAIYATAYDLQGNSRRATVFVNVRNEGATSPDIPAPPSLMVRPVTLNVAKGREFSVDILLNTDERSVVAVAAHLSYDPSILELVNIDVSNSAFPVEASRCPFQPCAREISEGGIQIDRGIPSPGIKGKELSVARLVFRSIKEGQTQLSFSLSAPGQGPSRIVVDTASGEADALMNVGNGSYTITPARGDLNNDGRVDVLDLGILLSSWGRTGSNIVADLNNDGKVDIMDLGILLSHWGA